MLRTFEDPHGGGLPRPSKSACSIEPHGLGFGDEDVLMKSAIASHKAFDDLSADTFALVLREDQQMRIVGYQPMIGDRVAETDQRTVYPRGDH